MASLVCDSLYPSKQPLRIGLSSSWCCWCFGGRSRKLWAELFRAECAAFLPVLVCACARYAPWCCRELLSAIPRSLSWPSAGIHFAIWASLVGRIGAFDDSHCDYHPLSGDSATTFEYLFYACSLIRFCLPSIVPTFRPAFPSFLSLVSAAISPSVFNVSGYWSHVQFQIKANLQISDVWVYLLHWLSFQAWYDIICDLMM